MPKLNLSKVKKLIKKSEKKEEKMEHKMPMMKKFKMIPKGK